MISVKIYRYEFRVNRETLLTECRCEELGWDWAVRRPEELNISDDHMSAVGGMILQLSSIFPHVEPELPRGADITEHSRHKDPVTGPV